MSESLQLFGLAALAAVAMVFSFEKGFVPTYLTGGASRRDEPAVFWIGMGVLGIALAGCLVGAFLSL